MKDYFGYVGQKCVVTGGSSGMGAALIERLVDCGAEVYVLDVKPPEIEGVKFIQANLAEKASIDDAFKQLPDKFDKFFGCAGVSGLNQSFEVTVIINLLANKYICEEYLLKNERIVNGGAVAIIGSQGAGPWLQYKDEYLGLLQTKTWEEGAAWLEQCLKDYPGAKGYYLSKRAITYYAKMMVVPFGKKLIRINTIAPGGTKTPILKEFAAKIGNDALQRLYLGMSDDYNEPRNMAEPLLCLNSSLFDNVSGLNVLIDFGNTAFTETDTIPDNRRPIYNGSALG